MRDRRKNLRNRRLPHLVATLTAARSWVMPMWCCFGSGRPIASPSSIRSISITSIVGRGVGRLLMQELIDACAAAGFRQMIGYIDADNAASLALHEKFGFPGSACFPASPIDTAVGPTASWCSARLAPASRLPHRPHPSRDDEAGNLPDWLQAK